MLDCQVYGLWAGGHHLTNVFLHAACAVLLFLMLLDMTGALWRSGFVAAVFAIHPLRVESVAWVSELKDVLSGVFFMLTLWAYLRYTRSPVSKSRYAMVLLWFALGLLSKPMLVTVPFVLILLDYWPLGRFQNLSQLPGLLREKILLFALSALSCVATVIAERHAIQPVAHVPLLLRIGNALVAYVVYLGKLIWPSDLAVLYPLVTNGWPAWQVIGSLLFLAGLSVGAYLSRRRQPYLLAGWLWYLGMLAPVIGILQVGEQAYADRYTYLPQIGLCLAGTWTAADWAGRRRDRRAMLGTLALIILSTLVVLAYHQTTYWYDSETLWTRALDCTRDNFIAHNNLGLVPLQQGRPQEAMLQFREALRIDPADGDAHDNLGNALFQLGRTDEAIAEYRKALELDPADADSHSNLGAAFSRQGRTEDAIAQFREAVRLNPFLGEPHYDLGVALFQQGDAQEAIAEYRKALELDPADANADCGLGSALSQQGRIEEAIAEFREALRINPTNADAHSGLGNALLHQGQIDDAIAEFREALRINPGLAVVHNNLGLILFQQGRPEEAVAEYRAALQCNPVYVEAQNNLGNALLRQGRTGEAIAAIQKALDLQPTNVLIQNNLAWMLATAPQASLRDGARAVQLATQASQASGGNNPLILHTLAAAYAEAGQFPNAVQTARKALQLARAQSRTALANALPREIKLYEAAEPYRTGQ
jgi:Flp pilus assembly protein TadD